MKRAVLFLLANWERKKDVDRETDGMLIARLESSEYRVVRASSMAWVHTLLESRSFDAVLISRRYIDAYKLVAERHLQDPHSEHIIIVWDRDGGGNVSCEIFQNPEFSRQEGPPRPNYMDAAKAVARALETSNPAEAPYTPAPRDHAMAFPDPTSHELHRKQALILDAISAGGTRGADIPMITYRVWGTNEWDRKKDIQIYVSKLRRFLAKHEGPKCSISYRDKRYYLTQDGERT